MSYLLLCLIIGVCLYHLYVSKTIRHDYKNKKMTNLALLLNKFFLFAPIIALLIFSVLFSTVLKGKMIERSSHALILFFLWLLFTKLYLLLISLKPQKYTTIGLIMSGVLFLGLIIFLTPLDRYITYFFNPFKYWTYALALFECFIFYAGSSFKNKLAENH
ncbi:hypothetical protein [Enterococcus xiangfangensis]|uniref:hypothetical protein n=1 Tax=Enterococcus xiangfangensis TaxID=1296537 RepID=UPI0010F71A91|nr:hypothetical protein [Enterococcus xiangfangensis]MBM7710889.1 putative membrane protein YqjE [Enterococcus xiangfangensis]NBK07909.1 hypothetical protein [Enterococcus asini]